MQDETSVENKGLAQPQPAKRGKLASQYTADELDAMPAAEANKIRDERAAAVVADALAVRERWLNEHRPSDGPMDVVITTKLSDATEVFIGYDVTVKTNKPTRLTLEERRNAQSYVRQNSEQFGYLELPDDWKSWK